MKRLLTLIRNFNWIEWGYVIVFVIIMLLWIFGLTSCGTPKEATEYKLIEIDFEKVIIAKRWINGSECFIKYWLYIDKNNGEHLLPIDLGKHNLLPVIK